jgi:hypothetical protein
MPIYPSVKKSNPIPFLLSRSSPTPVVLPILSRASLPGNVLVTPKTHRTIKNELLSHNPVKLLFEARQRAEHANMLDGKIRNVNTPEFQGFPRNLKIESTVDEGADWLPDGQRGVQGRLRGINSRSKRKIQSLINRLP